MFTPDSQAWLCNMFTLMPQIHNQLVWFPYIRSTCLSISMIHRSYTIYLFFLLTWMLLRANIQYRVNDKFVCKVYISSCKRKWFHQQMERWESTTHDGGTSTEICYGHLSITRRDYFWNWTLNLARWCPLDNQTRAMKHLVLANK